MDPKEYAARLERMRRQLEQEKVSNDFNRAMETSPMVDTTERLYAEFKAAKKPKAKKPVAKKADAAREPSGQRKYPNGFLDLRTGGGQKAARNNPETRRLMEGGVSLDDVARMQAAQRAAAAPAKKAEPSQPAQPRASDKPPDEELMKIEHMSPEEAMAEWSQIASSTGVTGKKSPRDAAILEALRKKKSLYDDSNVKQAPATPYVPSWMGVRK